MEFSRFRLQFIIYLQLFKVLDLVCSSMQREKYKGGQAKLILLRFLDAMKSHNSVNKILVQAKTHCEESLRVEIILTSLEIFQISIDMHQLDKAQFIHITENCIAIHVKKKNKKAKMYTGQQYLSKEVMHKFKYICIFLFVLKTKA